MKRPIRHSVALIAGISLLGMSTPPATATGLPVVDALHTAVSEVNWIANLAEWSTSIANEVEQITQMYTYLKQFGDPEALIGMLGIDEILESAEIAQLMDSYKNINDAIDGVYALERDANGLIQQIKQTSWDGVDLGLNPDNYRQAAMHGQIVDQYYQKSEENLEAREEIKEKIQSTLTELDSATDASQVARITAKLQGLYAQQADVNAADQIAAAQSTIATNDLAVTNDTKKKAAAHSFDAAHTTQMAVDTDVSSGGMNNLPQQIPQ